MRTRRLGRTGYQVSEIGFGAWGIGGAMWRGVDDATSRQALHTALDAGMSFIDTALAYGDGHSERLIGEVLRERSVRDQVVVATKIPPMDYVWPGKAATPISRTFPADHVARCVEMSARNLGTDSIPIVQFHVWHDAWLEAPEWEASREAMMRLTDQGKVRHWGVSVNDHDPESAARIVTDPLIESAQIIYNIFERSPELGFFDLARLHDVGIIVRVPFDEGALTGTIGPETVFPPEDWRARYFRGERKAEAARRTKALERLLGSEARSLPELALRFCLSRQEVSTVIPGVRRAEHARANAAVSDGRSLSPEILERLREHAWEKNWYA